MKPILLPHLKHTEQCPHESHSSELAGYDASHAIKPIKQTIQPAVHLGLIVNYSPSAGISVELVEFHVILITD